MVPSENVTVVYSVVSDVAAGEPLSCTRITHSTTMPSRAFFLNDQASPKFEPDACAPPGDRLGCDANSCDAVPAMSVRVHTELTAVTVWLPSSPGPASAFWTKLSIVMPQIVTPSSK